MGSRWMKKETAVVGILLVLAALTFSCSSGKPDRASLVKQMDRYLEAVVKHDPSAAPIAKDVKFVENIQQAVIG